MMKLELIRKKAIIAASAICLVIALSAVTYIFFRRPAVVIDKLLTTHDEILDLLHDAQRAKRIPEGGVVVVNVDAHSDFSRGRYIDFFFDGEWASRDKLMSRFINNYFYGSREEAKEAWKIALAVLEGSWCDVAIVRGWVKEVIWINPDTFEGWVNRPADRDRAITRIKSSRAPVWLTIDYDYFAREEHYKGRGIDIKYQMSKGDVDKHISGIMEFFEKNGIRVQRVVPALSPEYITRDAKGDYVDYLTTSLRDVFSRGHKVFKVTGPSICVASETEERRIAR
ncbi:hypothetical protein ACFL0T_05425 [Candidatus Omnitrophota bacterium]